MGDDCLQRIADQGLADGLRIHSYFGQGGEVEEQDRLLLVTCQHRFPVGLFNAAFPLIRHATPEQADRWLSAALAFFRKRQRGFSMYAVEGQDDALWERCLDAGFVEQRPSPAMVCTERLTEIEVPRLSMRLARTAKDIADFVEVAAPVYADTGLPRAITERMFADQSRVLSSGIAVWTGYVEGEPVTTCWVQCHGGVGGLYWVATLPYYRKRGYGGAITKRATNHAFEQGARAVTLQASEMGDPVYRELGYQPISRYRWAFRSHTT